MTMTLPTTTKAKAFTNAELQAMILKLTQENEALKKSSPVKKLTLKISEKGGLSIYGLGRFPVTLYKEQWLRLLDIADEIRAFIKANDSTLRNKGE